LISRPSYLHLFALALVPACASIIGYEDLHEGPLGDASSATGAGGNVIGASGSAGASVTSSSGGNNGGSDNPGGAGEGGAAGDSTGMGGASDGGTATKPDGALDAPVANAVAGTVIDYWKHPVPNATVALGTQSVVTAADGKFQFANVPASYDISVTLGKSPTGSAYNQGWLFQGVTRRDPTLQIYRALAAHGFNDNTTLSSTIAGLTFPLPSQRAVKLAFGSPDGTFQYEPDYNPYDDASDPDWRGPSTTQGTLHALLWTYSGTTSTDPPASYLGYDSLPLTLVAGTTVHAALDVSKMKTIASAATAGNVTSSSTSQRENDVYLVFGSRAILQLVSVTATTPSFSYIMPTIPESSITISAQRGFFTSPPFSIAHTDNLTAGMTGVALTIPDPPALIAPFDSATGLNDMTDFSWTNPGKVSYVAFRFDTVVYYVVTAGNKTKFPKFGVNGLELPSGAGTWSVETHGYATVDDATGPNGGLDPFAATGIFWGPPRGSGSFAWSETRSLTTQ
jgi:hypothetical protein